MAPAVKDSFLDLERHRQLLEENISKLRKSLQHWQIWEAEYEGLKEEILAARPTPNQDQLAAIGDSYEGELLNLKEIREILGGQTPRTADQVVNILEKRIDYVHQNVETIEKQVEKAENKLVTATIISNPDVRNEEGLPMTEITEELDEEGNVISSHTSTPGSAEPQLLEALKKVGVTDSLDDKPPSISKWDTSNTEGGRESLLVSKQDSTEKNISSSIARRSNATSTASPAPKKSVRFEEDIQSPVEIQKSTNARRIESIMNKAKELDEKPGEPPVIPIDESPSDAKLRKEMLQYGMSEIGAVVAELDVEEGSDWSDEDYEMDETASSDEEDEFGRSTRRVVDDDLRLRMRELEERLGVRMENVGKNPDHYDVVKEGIGRVTIKGEENPSISNQDEKLPPVRPKESPENKSGSDHVASLGKKNVRFSESLDISLAPQIQQQPSPSASAQTVIPTPARDIVERKLPIEPVDLEAPRKQSRFKSARASNILNGPLARSDSLHPAPSLPPSPASSRAPKAFSAPVQFAPVENRTLVVPTGPEGMTLAPTVVERAIPEDTVVPEPDELDPQLLHQEVAVEYHRRRNQMIQKQGGFLKKEESEIVPLGEEEGGPKKLSRFKAARLANS
ncbi:hypothetical protein B7463_g9926, partial [Scytalidium lignicola]